MVGHRRDQIDERGASSIEYGLMVALIAVTCLVAIFMVGEAGHDKFCMIASAIGASCPDWEEEGEETELTSSCNGVPSLPGACFYEDPGFCISGCQKSSPEECQSFVGMCPIDHPCWCE